MPGKKLENAAYQQKNWQDETIMINLMKKGYYNLTFTNMDNTSEPAIAAGSSIELDGVFYTFDTEEAITDPGVVDGIVYVTITGGTTATASFTNDALPEYDFGKNGYYGVSGERYVLELQYANSYWYGKKPIDSRGYNLIQDDENAGLNSSERPLNPDDGEEFFSIAQATTFTYSETDKRYLADPDPGAGYSKVYYDAVPGGNQATGDLCFDTIGDISSLKLCINKNSNLWVEFINSSDIEQYILPYLDTAKIFTTTTATGAKIGDIYIGSSPGYEIKISDGTENTANWTTLAKQGVAAPTWSLVTISNSSERALEPSNGQKFYSAQQATTFTYSATDNRYLASPDPGAGHSKVYYDAVFPGGAQETGDLCFDTVGDISSLKICVNGAFNLWRSFDSLSQIQQYILPYLDTAKAFDAGDPPAGSKVGDIYISGEIKIGDGSDVLANWFTVATSESTPPSQ
jgi:hypothetical protein